ncbi:coiled-coil and C2 domain-containing protein 1-like isoform X1 [Hydractinia symbiolongicarpus]|uniref:coiled-coil and C2 domain-containing protein 1-like isoform X1 n=2 Tax=Hydractinia symbiolongicarpus TaxID=13093 RepID=UPI00254D9D33|nr:coiled-coil and C2 domain-containing protein 1-like isoform X1 [Hydractinia symbiolongicarpus]
MFGKKAAEPRPANRAGNNDLANMLGLGVPMQGGADDDDDEDSLLAELAALQGRSAPAKKKAHPKRALVSMDEIDRMAAEGMKDIDHDEDDDDVDESDLLAELEDLASDNDENDAAMETEPSTNQNVTPSLANVLNERKDMYVQALATAKAEGASSKVRRLDRGLKEIDGLLKKVQKGGKVSEDDIPPPVAVKVSKPIDPKTQFLPPPPSVSPAKHIAPVQPITAPVQPITASPERPPRPTMSPKPQQAAPETEVPSETGTNAQLNTLLERQKQFKIAALKMKQHGNVEAARKYLSTSKQFDTVIEALKAGKEIDLSNMPEPPDLQDKQPASSHAPTAKPEASKIADPPAASSAPLSGPPPAATTILEALEQRLQKYEESALKAKEEGNGGKARRMGRITKQYQDAIRSYKAKKPVDFNELPCPPGFGPIPGIASEVADPLQQQSGGVPAPTVIPPTHSPSPAPPSATPSTTKSPPKPASRNEKEYEFLVSRQKEFKMAAIQAKKGGDMDAAREYLRQAKGLDDMILGAQNGMRVEVTTVPTLKKVSASIKDSSSGGTSLKESAEFSGSVSDQYKQIETALRQQIEASEKNAKHYQLLGNLDASKNFNSLLASSKKDLNTLLHYKQQKSPVPKCNYITKSFPVVRSNPQLSDSELELTVIRCVNVPLPSGFQPKDMHIYITYELAYPQEKPQSGYTTTKKETINPEYNESFKLAIDRKNRNFVRFCKRQALNLKVYYVRGFLKSDKAIGQASIKLEHFNNRCEIHESVDLVDMEKGRKSVGGKIEVMLKIREPLVDKDAEIVKEKWLVLDTHLRGLEMKTTHQAQPQASSTSETYECLEVLKHEKDMYERQIGAYKSQGKQPPPTLMQKLQTNQQKMNTIQNKMKQGGKQGVTAYLRNLTTGLEIEKVKAQNALRNNDKETAKSCLSRKKLIEKEIGVLRQRLGI